LQADMNTPIETDTVAPSAPGGLTASGGLGQAQLSWSAATDNVGVVRYNVHRSTTSGFTPSAANRVAQTTSTSHLDGGIAAGTYFYKVTAEDAAGNVGPASNQASATATSDTTGPTVAVSAPAAGATVSGTVSVTASATDSGGVAGVQFKLDGANLGAEDTSTPYSVAWNTLSAANGQHTLSAVARDNAGNTTASASVQVNVSNTGPPGLVAAYGFNEGSGTVVGDSSGTGNNGAATSTSWNASGRFGGALQFNGTSSLVTIPHTSSLGLTGGMTIEAWVRPTALLAWNTVVLKEHQVGLAYSLYANGDTANPSSYLRIAGAEHSVHGTAPVALNTWTHLAATYDGATMRFFVNGTQVGAQPRTGNIEASTNALYIGGNQFWGEHFTGLIDEVRVYNRALTAAQIQTDMNSAI
jgi:Concanavalin A-like lectin/glucanases superfamily/Bacterial Ig domain